MKSLQLLLVLGAHKIVVLSQSAKRLFSDWHTFLSLVLFGSISLPINWKNT